ncbi:hypothetical protein BGZ47_000402 [Haplosporangium gracile]|nr:hypothetical protein BGZ47_000402 [Haplosporangium gracile]
MSSASTAGENRKAALDQDGQARQPDIVSRTEEGHEVYYGELKGVYPSTLSSTADTLQIAIFTKDSLDGLLRVLEEDLPLISFRSVGLDVVFFLGAKITNAVVHTRISNLTMPTCLSELRLLDQTFFFQDVPDSVISPDYQQALEAKAMGAYGGQQYVSDSGHTSSKRGTGYSVQGEGG